MTTTQVYTLVTVDSLREVYATAHPRALQADRAQSRRQIVDKCDGAPARPSCAAAGVDGDVVDTGARGSER